MLRADALEVERWNRLHPQKRPRVAYVTEQLTAAPAPVVAVTDYVKSVPDQIARFVPGSLTTLGTDGYGRSDTRDALRRHFETDAAHLVGVIVQLRRADGSVYRAGERGHVCPGQLPVPDQLHRE